MAYSSVTDRATPPLGSNILTLQKNPFWGTPMGVAQNAQLQKIIYPYGGMHNFVLFNPDLS